MSATWCCVGCDRSFTTDGQPDRSILGQPGCPECARKWAVLLRACEPLGGLVAKDEGEPH